jgi:cytochrome P450
VLDELQSESLDGRIARYFAGDPSILVDPYPLYRELRAHGPVVESGDVALVARHADVKAVVLDPERFDSDYIVRGSRMESVRAQFSDAERVLFDEYLGYDRVVPVRMNGEDHRRIRNVVQRVFTPSRVGSLRPRVESYLDEFLARVTPGEPMDFLPFAAEVPLAVTMDLLDFPQEDADAIRDWTRRIMNYRGQHDPDALRAATGAVNEFTAYIERVIEEHRRGRRHSELVANMLEAHSEDRLTPLELAVACASLLIAGHETTSHLLANGLLELLTRRDQWEILCANPDELAPTAVEELLRHVSPVQWVGRVAGHGAEIDGVPVAEETTLFLLLGSANRDETVFADPDRLDIRRPAKKDHLSFGLGLHYCLGTPLAGVGRQLDAAGADRASRSPFVKRAVRPCTTAFTSTSASSSATWRWPQHHSATRSGSRSASRGRRRRRRGTCST